MKSSLPPFLKSEKFLRLHLGLQRKHCSVGDKNAIAANVVFTKTIITFIGCLLFSSLKFHVDNFFLISLGLELSVLKFGLV